MKKMRARFEGTCQGCNGPIQKGQWIQWERGKGAFHDGCAPTGHPRQDAEYMQGVQDARNWQENRRMFGDEVADRMEIERELREGWDY